MILRIVCVIRHVGLSGQFEVQFEISEIAGSVYL